MTHLPRHSNDAWLAALRDEGGGGADMVRQLEAYVRRALAVTLRRRALARDELDELTQEAFSKLLANLHTFRGDAALPTWAVAVATRVAFTELRRRDARQKNHAEFEEARAAALRDHPTGRAVTPDVALTREAVLGALDRAIESDLTEKQRIAMLALLRGVPTIEIAERTGSNQNAVYKLVHDARLRLREALERRGVTVDAVDDLSTREERP